MVRKLLVLAALAACSTPPPGPTDKPLQAEKALASIWKSFGVPGTSVPIYGVDADPRCTTKVADGTWFAFYSSAYSGKCVGGYTDNREAVWVVLPPVGWRRKFSHSLPHEAMHVLGYTHEGLDTWDPESQLGKLIAKAQADLEAQPDINTMLVVGETLPPPPPPAPVVDDCTDPVDACVLFPQLEGQIMVAKKDAASLRGAAGRWCTKTVNGEIVETYFKINQICEYAQTCQQPGGFQTPATCVACGIEGNRSFTQTKAAASTLRCEGCNCPYAKSSCEGGLVKLLDVGTGLSVNADGQVLGTDVDQKLQYLGVHKMNLHPGGEYDFEIILDSVEVIDGSQRIAVRTEARIAGTCK